MNSLFRTTQSTVVRYLKTTAKGLSGVLAVGAISCTLSCSDSSQQDTELTIDSTLDQAVFVAPEDAANAFVLALRNEDAEMLHKVLGAEYREVLSLDEVDDEDIGNFLGAWEKFNSLIPQGENKVLIAVGEGEWTLPIPVSKGTSGWHFDVIEGLERTRIRRIGRNELSAMQAVLAYYDAQMEYAQLDRNGNGMLEYAQKFISTPGAQDGLFWEDETGDNSPLGPLIADLTPGGGYFGYYYRILDAQGEHARGGAYSYMLGDRMRAGFALVAWPEEYGESGVMSFLVSHEGIVYEQNLGPDGAENVQAMTSYNPDEGWVPAKEVNGPQANGSL